MNKVIWVHEKALNKTQLIEQNVNNDFKAIFVWDDNYFRSRSYSLKRLVFIYETVCEMPVTIIKGDIFEVIKSLDPGKIKTSITADSLINKIIFDLSKMYEVEVMSLEPFVLAPDSLKLKRFFEYWNTVKNSALVKNGGRLV